MYICPIAMEVAALTVFVVWLGPAIDSSQGISLKEIGSVKAISGLKTKFVVIRYYK
jgi:hypothetical protein